MTSLHYVSSTDPSNYGTVKYSMTPVVCQPCQVRVSSIQYTATFSITTDDDYIEFEQEDKTITRFEFSEKNNYLPETLIYDLTTIFLIVLLCLLYFCYYLIIIVFFISLSLILVKINILFSSCSLKNIYKLGIVFAMSTFTGSVKVLAQFICMAFSAFFNHSNQTTIPI